MSTRGNNRGSGADSSKETPELVDDSSANPSTPGTRFRIIASLFILFHLAAVVLPPLAFQTFSSDGPSPLIGNLIRPVSGYSQFLHIDRGYAFFAPDPGPSHLFQAAMTEADGSIRELMYPDLERQWPRLLYHRHFMLAEFLNDAYWPPGPPDEMFASEPEAAEIWQRARARYEYIRQSLTDHLRSENDGRAVAIRRIEHTLPGLTDFVQEPIELDDPRLYQVLLDQPIFDDEMAPRADEPTEEIPAPELNNNGEREVSGSVPLEDEATSSEEDGSS